MKIQELFDNDKFIRVNDIKEVKTQRLYASRESFDPNGLFSEDIFGQTDDERKYRFGYIQLPTHLFNPYIAKHIIKRSGGIIRKMADNEIKCSIRNGQLIEDENGKYSGIKDLYSIWDSIDLKKTVSSERSTVNDILIRTPKRLLFSDKLLVLPPAFRQIGTKNGRPVKSELNTLYMRVLGLCSVSNNVGSSPRMIYSQIQEAIINIYTFIENQVAKKDGFFQKNLLSKTTTWKSAGVISAPRYNTEDPEVGIFRSGYPLHILTSLFDPIVKFQLKQMLRYDSLYTMVVNKNDLDQVTLSNIYDDKKISDLMMIYKKNAGNRFKHIYADKEQKKPLLIEFEDMNNNGQKIRRPLTLTDIIYQAVYQVCVAKQRMVYNVRYPIGDYLGAYFTGIHILSTNRTCHIRYMGIDYTSYPVIDLKATTQEVSISFRETINPSNSRLDAIGGDSDGDTLSVTGIWSDDANEEARKLMMSKIYNIKPDLSTVYQIGKECINGLYGLTKFA
jgi:DNA-directed RNA polymerase beta' subunit